MRILSLGLGFGVAVSAVALAAAAPSAPTAGDWRLSEVGGKVACTLSLTHETSPGGFEVHTPLACRLAFPPLQTVAAWAVDDKGGIVLNDAQAKPIIAFPQGADGSFEAKAPDGRTWRLDPEAAVQTPAG